MKITECLRHEPATKGALHAICMGCLVSTVTCLFIGAVQAGNTKPEKYFSLQQQKISWSDLPEIGSSAKTRVRQSRIDALFAVVKGENSSWTFGSGYAYTRYLYDQVNSRNRDLHRISFPVSFSKETDQLFWSLHISPGIATSSNAFKDPLNRLKATDFIITGGFTSHLAVNDQWKALLGAGRDHRFGTSRWYPITGLMFSGPGRLKLRLAYPDSLFSFKLNERFDILAAIYPSGNQWNVHTDDFQQEFTYNAEGWRIETSLKWRMRQRLATRFAAGYEFDRRIRFDDNAGISLSPKIDNNLIFSIELEIALN